jgi:hypothetical protein
MVAGRLALRRGRAGSVTGSGAHDPLIPEDGIAA